MNTKILVAVLLLLGSQSILASTSSFTGTFSNDNEVQFFDFTLAADSTSVIINTWSFNGGTNAAGEVIAAGGFNPYLSLWDKSTGMWVFDTTNKSGSAKAVIRPQKMS